MSLIVNRELLVSQASIPLRIESDGRTLVRDKHVGNVYLRFGVVSEWLAEALKPPT